MSWGRIIYDEKTEDVNDPVIKLLKQIDETRENLLWEKDETYEKYKDRQDEIINNLEHQISDIIYQKKIRNIAR